MRFFFGHGTSFQVSIPMRAAISSSAAFNQAALSGDFKTCFHVLGTNEGTADTDVLFSHDPKRDGGLGVLSDRRGVGLGDSWRGTGRT